MDEENNKLFPIMLKNYIQQYVVGQDSYLEQLCMKIYRYHVLGMNEAPLLVIGPTGCGKTYAIEVLKQCKLLKPKEFTIVIYDASSLTPNGFTGESMSDIIKIFKNQAVKDFNVDKRGIIYLDEIDKIIVPNHDSASNNVNALVQHQLMNMLSGTIIDGVDTSKILFVLGGAFYMLDNIEKENIKKSIGFSYNDNSQVSLVKEASLRDNLISMGAQREFLGRVRSIVRLPKLNELQLKCVLLHPYNGYIAEKKNVFKKCGLDFDFSPKLVNKLVEMAVEEDLGARSVKNMVDVVLKTYDYYMLEENYTYMYLDDSVLDGKSPYFEKSKKESQN